MQAISDLGDSALLVPLSIGLVLVIWHGQSRSAALTLFTALGFCVIVTLFLKIGLIACSPVWRMSIVSPSGHTSFSTAVYGAIALVAVRHTARSRLPMIIALTSILIACIAASRIAIGAHSAAEVAVGMLVGIIALALFAVQYLRERAGTIKVSLLLALAGLALLLFYGTHLPAEQWIREFAYLSKRVSNAC